jgi:glutathione S-transferase
MLEELCDTYFEAINWAIFEIRVFQRATGDLAERLEARAAGQRAGCNAYLERALAGRPYFNGSAFGWGDLAVVPFVQAAAITGSPPAEGSALAAWLARVIERPSVADTMQAATQSMAGFEMLPQLVASGQFRREYRDHRLEWMLRSGAVDVVLDGIRKDNIRFSRELE